MTTAYALIAVDITRDPDGIYSARRILHNLVVPAFPAVVPKLAVLVSWKLYPSDSLRHYTVDAYLMDEDGRQFHRAPPVPVTIHEVSSNSWGYWDWAFDIRDIAFPRHGWYRVVMECDGEPLTEIEFGVYQGSAG